MKIRVPLVVKIKKWENENCDQTQFSSSKVTQLPPPKMAGLQSSIKQNSKTFTLSFATPTIMPFCSVLFISFLCIVCEMTFYTNVFLSWILNFLPSFAEKMKKKKVTHVASFLNSLFSEARLEVLCVFLFKIIFNFQLLCCRRRTIVLCWHVSKKANRSNIGKSYPSPFPHSEAIVSNTIRCYGKLFQSMVKK